MGAALLFLIALPLARSWADDAGVFFENGVQAFRQHDYDRAIGFFQRGLRANPSREDAGAAQYYLGQVYEALHRPQDALDSYRAAQTLAPQADEAALAVRSQTAIEQQLQSRLQAATGVADPAMRRQSLQQIATEFPREPAVTVARDKAAQDFLDAVNRIGEIMAISDPEARLRALNPSFATEQRDRDALSLPQAEALRAAARQQAAQSAPPRPPSPPPAPPPPPNRAAQLMAAGAGFWTTRSAADCSSHHYYWSNSGNLITFRDERGQIDEEYVVDAGDNLLHTRTASSSHSSSPTEATGSLWEYRFLGNSQIQVQNLSTGSRFVLTRCP